MAVADPWELYKRLVKKYAEMTKKVSEKGESQEKESKELEAGIPTKRQKD